MIGREILETFILPAAIDGEAFNLAGQKFPRDDLAQYVNPESGTCDHYCAHLNKFPPNDRPEVFGIHYNANYACIEQDGAKLLRKIYEYQFEHDYQTEHIALGGQDQSNVEHAARFKRCKIKLRDVEVKLPDLINEELLARKFKRVYEDCLSTMMHQEVERYNTLIQQLQVQVKTLIRCLDGETIMDDEMEEEFRAVVCDKTPLKWLSLSYPSSRILPNFLDNLQERVEYINEILDQKEDGVDLYKFWLPGLFDQGSFFSMILQQEARRKGLPMNELTYQYTVTNIYDDA